MAKTSAQKVAISMSMMLQNEAFYGALALGLDIIETKNIESLATDMKALIYNPDYIQTLKMNSDSKQNEVVSGIKHELNHIILKHMLRGKGLIYPINNFAADYIANAMLMSEGQIVPEGWLYEQKYGNLQEWGFEKVYADLMKNVRIIEKKYGGNGKEGGKDKKGKGDGDEDGEGYGPNGINTGEFSGIQKPGDSHETWNKATEEDSEEWSGKIAQAAVYARTRGDLPGGLQWMLDEMFRPKKNWKQILREFVIPTKSDDYSFMSPDRRFLHSNMILPDHDIEDSIMDLIFCADSSGSIANEEFSTALAEARAIVSQFPQIRGHLFHVDTEVCHYQKLEEKIPQVRHGGGGTSFVSLFKEIETRRIKPCGLVFFTDMYAEFPEKCPPYKVLWLVFGNYDGKAPFGRMVKYSN